MSSEDEKNKNLPSWVMPTVIVVALFSIIGLIMSAVALTDAPIVSNGGTGGGNGQNGSNGTPGKQGPPGTPGQNGSNGTNGTSAIFESQFFAIGYFQSQDNVLGFPTMLPLPTPVGNLFTLGSIINQPAGMTVPASYGDSRIQQLVCAKAGTYNFIARHTLQNTTGATQNADFILAVPGNGPLNPAVAGNLNRVIADVFLTQSNLTGQAQGWSSGTWKFNVGDILFVGYFASPASWGKANSYLNISLTAAA